MGPIVVTTEDEYLQIITIEKVILVALCQSWVLIIDWGMMEDG